MAIILSKLRALAGHAFWPDDITLLESGRVAPAHLLNSAQVTESYLLAVAFAHGGRLATLDRRFVTTAVVGGANAVALIK